MPTRRDDAAFPPIPHGEKEEHVKRRLGEFIAEGHGAARQSDVRNRLDPAHRRYLPVVLASGDYAVTVEPGGVVIRLRRGAQ